MRTFENLMQEMEAKKELPPGQFFFASAVKSREDLFEISVVQTQESFAMTSFISCHFMNCVMDCVKVCSFCSLSQICFACCSAVFSVDPHLKIFLGAVCDYFAKQFCEFGCVLCFFISSFFIVKADFRITFTMCHTCHSKVHTYFRAFTFKVCAKVSHDIFAGTLSNTYYMLSSPFHLTFLLGEFGSRCFTYRAGEICRKRIAFIHITTYRTYKFCHNFYFLSFDIKNDWLLNKK
jgi:hypothetical protein